MGVVCPPLEIWVRGIHLSPYRAGLARLRGLRRFRLTSLYEHAIVPFAFRHQVSR